MNEKTAGSRGNERTTGGADAGFSLIEALIATGILLMIAIGIIPLFANSILNNTRGADSTQATNYGRTKVENVERMDFNATPVTVLPGSQSLVTAEWWSPGTANQVNDATEGWRLGAVPAGTVTPWTRQTTVTQYKIDAIQDGVLDPKTEAKDGSTGPDYVQLKMIQVDITSGKQQSGLLGGGESITLRMVRAY